MNALKSSTSKVTITTTSMRSLLGSVLKYMSKEKAMLSVVEREYFQEATWSAFRFLALQICDIRSKRSFLPTFGLGNVALVSRDHCTEVIEMTFKVLNGVYNVISQAFQVWKGLLRLYQMTSAHILVSGTLSMTPEQPGPSIADVPDSNSSSGFAVSLWLNVKNAGPVRRVVCMRCREAAALGGFEMFPSIFVGPSSSEEGDKNEGDSKEIPFSQNCEQRVHAVLSTRRGQSTEILLESVESKDLLALNEWTHIVCTFDMQEGGCPCLRLYINGKLSGERQLLGKPPRRCARPFHIGAPRAASFPGATAAAAGWGVQGSVYADVADLILHSASTSEDDVQLIFQAGRAIQRHHHVLEAEANCFRILSLLYDLCYLTNPSKNGDAVAHESIATPPSALRSSKWTKLLFAILRCSSIQIKVATLRLAGIVFPHTRVKDILVEPYVANGRSDAYSCGAEGIWKFALDMASALWLPRQTLVAEINPQSSYVRSLGYDDMISQVMQRSVDFEDMVVGTDTGLLYEVNYSLERYRTVNVAIMRNEILRELVAFLRRLLASSSYSSSQLHMIMHSCIESHTIRSREVSNIDKIDLHRKFMSMVLCNFILGGRFAAQSHGTRRHTTEDFADYTLATCEEDEYCEHLLSLPNRVRETIEKMYSSICGDSCFFTATEEGACLASGEIFARLDYHDFRFDDVTIREMSNSLDFAALHAHSWSMSEKALAKSLKEVRFATAFAKRKERVLRLLKLAVADPAQCGALAVGLSERDVAYMLRVVHSNHSSPTENRKRVLYAIPRPAGSSVLDRTHRKYFALPLALLLKHFTSGSSVCQREQLATALWSRICDTSPSDVLHPSPSPRLEALGGELKISPDTLRAVGVSNFPSIKLSGVSLRTGVDSGSRATRGQASKTSHDAKPPQRWMYEAVLLSDGLMQIGWADDLYKGDPSRGQGIGDHQNSWALDGYRRKKWNGVSSDYGVRWRIGDVVGCLVDLELRQMRFFINGEDLGVAFSRFDYEGGLFPAASFNMDQAVRFNFGPPHGDFAFPPPESWGYLPVSQQITNMVPNHFRASIGEPSGIPSTEELRRQGLVDNLITMGFPIDWCIRAASERDAGLDENTAIAWMIEQMDKAGMKGDETDAIEGTNTLLDYINGEYIDDIGSDDEDDIYEEDSDDEVHRGISRIDLEGTVDDGDDDDDDDDEEVDEDEEEDVAEDDDDEDDGDIDGADDDDDLDIEDDESGAIHNGRVVTDAPTEGDGTVEDSDDGSGKGVTNAEVCVDGDGASRKDDGSLVFQNEMHPKEAMAERSEIGEREQVLVSSDTKCIDGEQAENDNTEEQHHGERTTDRMSKGLLDAKEASLDDVVNLQSEENTGCAGDETKNELEEFNITSLEQKHDRDSQAMHRPSRLDSYLEHAAPKEDPDIREQGAYMSRRAMEEGFVASLGDGSSRNINGQSYIDGADFFSSMVTEKLDVPAIESDTLSDIVEFFHDHYTCSS